MDSKTVHTADLRVDEKSGVYVLTYQWQSGDSLTSRVLMKVGSAQCTYVDPMDTKHKRGGLGARLDSYLLYYPDGYTLFACYTTSKGKAVELERELQGYLKGKERHVDYPHTHTEEWFTVSPQEIQAACEQLESHYARPSSKGGMKKLIARSVVRPAAEVRYINGSGRSLTRPRVSAMTASQRSTYDAGNRQVPRTGTKRVARKPRNNKQYAVSLRL